ncbi:hypothetical protein SLE2022_101220 [Rubroshorea leprosula]
MSHVAQILESFRVIIRLTSGFSKVSGTTRLGILQCITCTVAPNISLVLVRGHQRCRAHITDVPSTVRHRARSRPAYRGPANRLKSDRRTRGSGLARMRQRIG